LRLSLSLSRPEIAIDHSFLVPLLDLWLLKTPADLKMNKIR